LDEKQGGFRIMWGWSRAKMGMVAYSKTYIGVAWLHVFMRIPHAKAIRALF
jgi:hypothetical protein